MLICATGLITEEVFRLLREGRRNASIQMVQLQAVFEREMGD